jgi:hypothetical protein
MPPMKRGERSEICWAKTNRTTNGESLMAMPSAYALMLAGWNFIPDASQDSPNDAGLVLAQAIE